MDLKKIHTCTGHRAALYALAPGRDTRHFISAGGDGWVVEWDLDAPENGTLIANTETQIFSICALPDPNRLVAGNMNGGLHWLERNAPDKTHNVQHHKKGVYGMLALNESLFTAGGDGLLTRWDTETARTVESIQLSNKALRCITFSAQRSELAIGASDGNIYGLDSNSLALKYTIAMAHANSVFSLAWSPDSQYLLSAGRDAWLRVWAFPNQGQPVDANKLSEAAHLFTINNMAFSPDGQLFASASRDKTIKIWDAHNFQLLKVIDTLRYGGHINSVNHLLWLPGGLVSASDDRSAMIWSISA